MGFLELTQKRQSCRKYLTDPVPQEKIERCLEAARLAPSACNSQPWKFIVVQDPQLKNKLAEQAFAGAYKMNAFAKQAPVLVVVIRESSKYAAKVGGFFQGIQYSFIDFGIACEHFILQAADEGLATCWIGWFNQRGVRKILGLPRNVRVDTIISLGYAENPTVREKNRKSLSEISEFR